MRSVSASQPGAETPFVVDASDGFYNLGFPETVGTGEVPLIASATGIMVFTSPDPALETEIVRVTVVTEAEPSTGADASEPGISLDVELAEECRLMSGFAEESEPPSPPVIGPGKWRVTRRVTAGPALERPGGEDMAETVIEHHRLTLTPLDPVARSWQPGGSGNHVVGTAGRDDISEGWFIDARPGDWLLTADGGRLEFLGDVTTPRMRATPEGLRITIAKKSDITVLAKGSALRLIPREGRQLCAEVTLPIGAHLVVRRPDGLAAKGLPERHEALAGPARISVWQHAPDEPYELDDDGNVEVYVRDSFASDYVDIDVLLE